MLYKIQCTPNEKVHSSVTGHLLFIADSKGFYITEDSPLAERASNKYPVWVIDASFAEAEQLVQDIEPVVEPVIDEEIEADETVEMIDKADTTDVTMEDEEPVDESEEQLRQRAKVAGVKHWHVKSKETLLKELGEE